MITEKDREIQSIISENLTALRKKKGVSILEICRHVDEPQNTVYRTFRGENMPLASLVMALADYFTVSVDEILRPQKGKRYRKVI